MNAEVQALYVPIDGGKPRPFEGEAYDRMMGYLDAAEVDCGDNVKQRIEHAMRADSEFLDAEIQKPGVRADAAPAGGGSAMARQLEHVYREVLTEPLPPVNLFSLFQRDNTVAVGARKHTVRRFLIEGEAKVWRGTDDDVPGVGFSQAEKSFPVRYLVTSFKSNLFERQSNTFANIPDQRLKMLAARTAIEQLTNRLGWYGSAAHDLYGVTNYPWMGTRVIATGFNPGSSPTDVLNALNALVNWPAENSLSTYKPNRLAVSTRLYNYLFQTRLGSVDSTTIGEFFLRNSRYITQIEDVHELQGTGPGGTDGLLAYEDSRLGVSVVTPGGITWLPLQISGFSSTRYVYMPYGGVVMRNAGSNIIGWTDPTA